MRGVGGGARANKACYVVGSMSKVKREEVVRWQNGSDGLDVVLDEAARRSPAKASSARV